MEHTEKSPGTGSRTKVMLPTDLYTLSWLVGKSDVLAILKSLFVCADVLYFSLLDNLLTLIHLCFLFEIHSTMRISRGYSDEDEAIYKFAATI
jgi:hypothetical protein